VHIYITLTLTLAREATAVLCTCILLSHAVLLPSTTATISSANRSAKLNRVFFLSAASMIQVIALRRLCRSLSGLGTVSRKPPDPLTLLSVRSGPTESTAVCRYAIGFEGSDSSGGAVGMMLARALGFGADLVRRIARTSVMTD
jgi:hypothetical protein